MGSSRRKFTKEFKEEAFRRLEFGGLDAEVARACEVNPNVLHRWRRGLRDYEAKAFSGNGQRRTEEVHVAELERKAGRQPGSDQSVCRVSSGNHRLGHSCLAPKYSR